jgi:hypothetical protein
VLEDWEERDLHAFSQLFDRFVSGFEDAATKAATSSGAER